MRRPSMALAILTFMIFAVALAAPALADVEAGVLDIRPLVQITETYDDNIYQENSNEVNDWITDLKGELTIGLPMEDFLLEARGMFDVFEYADTDAQDRTDYEVGAALSAEFPGGLGFKIGDDYSKNWLKPQDQEFANTGEDYFLNRFLAQVDYKTQDRYRIAARYDNNNYDYDESIARDRIENVFTGTFYWRFASKTSALAEYSYADFSYDENDFQDNVAHQLSGGLTWKVTGKSTGEAKIGYETKKYDDPAANDGDFLVLSFRLIHALSSRTTLTALAERASVETDFPGNPYYLSTYLDADLKHNFTAKIYGKAGLAYWKDDYPEANSIGELTGTREDDGLGLNLVAGWDPLRWLGFEAGYEYETVDSSFNLYDYDNNIFKISAKAAF